MASENRSAQLNKFLGSVAHGKTFITSADRAKRYLEAICTQDDHVTCVERLCSKQPSLDALRTALRIDNSIGFINSSIASFLRYISNPTIKQISSGQLLQDLLLVITDPPTLWNKLTSAQRADSLKADGTYAFAWLLWEFLQLPSSEDSDVVAIADSVTSSKYLLDSPCHEVRVLGHKIKHLLQSDLTGTSSDVDGPGGRHDNDFTNYRNIAILPTRDEFLSTKPPFYRPARDVFTSEPKDRVGLHLDNQFRLLREDMLAELKDAVLVAIGKKKGRRSPVVLEDVSLAGVECGLPRKWKECELKLHCGRGMEKFAALSSQDRKKYLKDNPRALKHQSFGCLLQDGEIVAFAVLDRDEANLLEDVPAITLKVCGEEALKHFLLRLNTKAPIDYVQVDTPLFAYEPILTCLQDMKDIPLAQHLLGTAAEETSQISLAVDSAVVYELRTHGTSIIQSLLKTEKPIKLDNSQLESLIAGLENPVSIIQGPPGTGKSFIGALIAKALYEHTSETILILSYTNHALDQFVEDLLDIGIPPSNIVRLGSKSTPRTAPLSLFEQQKSDTYKRSRSMWELVETAEAAVERSRISLSAELQNYDMSSVTGKHILDYLEFSDEYDHFYSAFVLPDAEEGMIRVGKGGKVMTEDYLYDRWSRGRNAGVLQSHGAKHPEIWGINFKERLEYIEKWNTALLEERAMRLVNSLTRYNQDQRRLARLLREKTLHTLKSMRIIGCTTTAAAKYVADIRGAAPGVLLVEEAGEILESHILTSLSPGTKQVILIGDHKQLRPKYSNYTISVEKGEGYDFNRSLFERLVLADYPHTTLLKQHRMCPEVSSIVRYLTYPDLNDADTTLNRPPLRGLRDRVIFFNHAYPEFDNSDLLDRRDPDSKASKSNPFEVDLVLKCVRYLGQQGYGTDKLVILTPYLGQLRLLRDRLMKDNDPVLNDLDSYDLIRAGLLSEASASINRRPIKISTIDNYQGEESDIVIASLTRSNDNGDIGFMFSPERLNVLLSRARDGLVLIGNAQTFLTSRRAGEAWLPFMQFMKSNGHIYDGLPVQCPQHPHKKFLLRNAGDFDTECPDGGCSEPCGQMLSCKTHTCPSRCHQLSDHSKMACHVIVAYICPQNHKTQRTCSKSQASCAICVEHDRRQEERRKRDAQLDSQREARQAAYAIELAEIQAEIDHHKRLLREGRDAAEAAKVLEQHRQNLASLEATAKDLKQQKDQSAASKATLPSKSVNTPPIDEDDDRGSSSAGKQWGYMKRDEGARNQALDELMEMIGLEDVKAKFLSIKNEVDTAARQGLDMSGKRFGASLLGNPGTGKTTVARLYARFLTSVGALPGSEFVETTGAALANEGVSACKKKLEDIQNNGGGALFIDEAYQLTSSGNLGGTAILDFILAEVENLNGKVVFILAGYNKQMEQLFAHNPGLPSRFPHELQFKDYEDDELLRILNHKIGRRYEGRMAVEDGSSGLYARIVARRIGRSRGREGFGNAREVENTLQRIASRQAVRISEERRAGNLPDDFMFTRSDLLGPEPAAALNNSRAWKQLQSLTGLASVKKSVQALLGTVKNNYNRELEEAPLVEYSLNKVFIGSPGTGKTTVAKLYGQILADLGLLSNGEVIIKNPSDFVGNVLGASESTTKGILASTVGKILLIDEAYGLYNASGDPYKTAVIDVIVSEVQSVPGDDRCVLLLGYKDQMERMFQNVNPGLSRRFPLASAFVFEDFDDEDLEKILNLKLSKLAFKTTDLGKRAAMDVLRRARNRPNFGNAGEVDILLDHAKAAQQQRLNNGLGSKDTSFFEPIDFDEDFDRGERAETNIRLLFSGVIGCDGIVSQLQGYQNAVKELRAMDMDPKEEIPFNFLFRGPPGTGKTSTARKMGKVYCDMGFLARADVEECSATEMIGSYVGQTAPKVQALLEKSLGRVLFIDEAYRLAGDGFAKEAMDEIVDCLTKPRYAQKLIVILAGYTDDINRLMAQNPGLTSRFPETINFTSLRAADCFDLLIRLLSKRGADMRNKNRKLSLSSLEDPTPQFKQEILTHFDTLCGSTNWANARDVQTIAKGIFALVIKAGLTQNTTAIVTEDHVRGVLTSMISERTQRQQSVQAQHALQRDEMIAEISAAHPHLPPATAGAQQATERAETIANSHTAAQDTPPAAPGSLTQRDAGVSDAVWQQLQHDKKEAHRRETRYEELTKASATAVEQLELIQHKEETFERASEENRAKAKEQASDQDEKRLREQARLQHELERRAQEELLAKLEQQRKAEEEARKKEAQSQQKLRTMGVCVAGYRWIKQQGGYRCAGGSHFVSDAQLA